MKKVIGLVLFWIAVGMLFMLLLDNKFWGIVIIAGTILVGYNLYMS